MIETDRFRFYLVKYFLASLSVLQAAVAILMLFQYKASPKVNATIFIFFSLSLIFFSLHILISDRIKRVAISKKKVTILHTYKRKSYNWSEVKEVKFLSFLNMYRLTLKGKSNRIYFLSGKDSEALFGLFSAKASFIPKKVSKA